MSNSLQPHGLQHAKLPCPSPSPGDCSDSYSLSRWCHPIISSSVALFSSCPQSFPALGSFPMSWLFTSGGQSIGASASVFPMNIKGWFPLGLTCLNPFSWSAPNGVWCLLGAGSRFSLGGSLLDGCCFSPIFSSYPHAHCSHQTHDTEQA